MNDPNTSLSPEEWGQMSTVAWQVRSSAFLYGNTAVGAAVLSKAGKIYSGCNVEHQFRSHDFHAETNAIGNMVSGGDTQILAVLVVAERERFTPCGACMDWIFQFGGPACLVGFQNKPQGKIMILTAAQLMPYYPF